MPFRPMLLLAILVGIALPLIAHADDPLEIHVTFVGDRFDPVDISVPVDVKFVLKVENRSGAAMEWESLALHREKLVPARSSTAIFIGPLRAGSYEYFDDFHPTIRGHVVAR